MAADPDASRVFGQPFETADGATVIPVARLRGGPARGADDSRIRLGAKPLGVFVVKDGKASFVPAVDAGRIAMMGILVGLVSAALAGVAMVRRPPWPDLHGTVEGWSADGEVAYIELRLEGTVGRRPFTMHTCDRIKLRDGKAVERVAYLDATPLVKAVARSPRAWPKFLKTQLRNLRRPA